MTLFSRHIYSSKNLCSIAFNHNKILPNIQQIPKKDRFDVGIISIDYILHTLFTITKNVNLRDHKTLVSLWS